LHNDDFRDSPNEFQEKIIASIMLLQTTLKEKDDQLAQVSAETQILKGQLKESGEEASLLKSQLESLLKEIQDREQIQAQRENLFKTKVEFHLKEIQNREENEVAREGLIRMMHDDAEHLRAKITELENELKEYKGMSEDFEKIEKSQ
jgi:chromosome segregation ATPase